MSVVYTKIHLNPSDLLERLKSANLFIQDDDKVLNILSKINYYRFKAYLYPFYDSATKKYISGSFEDGLELYRFDEALRNFVFLIISRVEIKLRSCLDQTIVNFTEDPFWYLDDKYFKDVEKIQETRDKISKSFQKSKETFALHFKENYVNSKSPEYQNLPPFWITAELTTLGDIYNISLNLNRGVFVDKKSINVLNKLASSFGVRTKKSFHSFKSWIALIRAVRNKSAHHARLWNSNLLSPSSVVNIKSQIYPSKIYGFFLMINQINSHKNLDIDIKTQLDLLFKEYPVISQHMDSMGFPEDWADYF